MMAQPQVLLIDCTAGTLVAVPVPVAAAAAAAAAVVVVVAHFASH
jgi:hypothetical protein